MANRDTVLLVGCGNMGFAMLKGWISSRKLAASDAYVVEPSDELRERAEALGAAAVASADELPQEITPKLIVLAVKPQTMDAVLPGYARFAPTSTFVSVAAGTRIAKLAEALGKSAAIVRVMPNTPAAVGAGMMVMYANPNVADAEITFTRELMQASGEVAEVDDEALMDAVTAVSGSGPAYLFHMIEALTAAAKSAGLPDDVASLLARQTIYGAAVYARESETDPGTLREQVTSPNGTTAAALDVLMGGERLVNLMTEAVEAARKRSVELGGQ